jgi:hypothetical protein
MPRFLEIELHNGRKIRRDLSSDRQTMEDLSRGANDLYFATMCQAICVGGCTDPELNNSKVYRHISPTQIKHVTIDPQNAHSFKSLSDGLPTKE